MNLKTFTLIYGLAFTLVGVLGFVPGITQPHDNPNVALDAGLGTLFGLFPVNYLHNVIHLVFGLWALSLARQTVSDSARRGYAKTVAVVYLVLALMGIFPFLNTTFGLVPIYGHDIWLHAILGLGAAYFGFAYGRSRDTVTAPR